MRRSISEVIAPSRIQERSYEREPGCNGRAIAIDEHVRERTFASVS